MKLWPEGNPYPEALVSFSLLLEPSVRSGRNTYSRVFGLSDHIPVRKRQILVLDEASASLDKRTDLGQEQLTM